MKIDNLNKNLKKSYEKGYFDASRFDFIRTLRNIRKNADKDSVSSHGNTGDESFDINQVIHKKGRKKAQNISESEEQEEQKGKKNKKAASSARKPGRKPKGTQNLKLQQEDKAQRNEKSKAKKPQIIKNKSEETKKKVKQEKSKTIAKTKKLQQKKKKKQYDSEDDSQDSSSQEDQQQKNVKSEKNIKKEIAKKKLEKKSEQQSEEESSEKLSSEKQNKKQKQKIKIQSRLASKSIMKKLYLNSKKDGEESSSEGEESSEGEQSQEDEEVNQKKKSIKQTQSESYKENQQEEQKQAKKKSKLVDKKIVNESEVDEKSERQENSEKKVHKIVNNLQKDVKDNKSQEKSKFLSQSNDQGKQNSQSQSQNYYKGKKSETKNQQSIFKQKDQNKMDIEKEDNQDKPFSDSQNSSQEQKQSSSLSNQKQKSRIKKIPEKKQKQKNQDDQQSQEQRKRSVQEMDEQRSKTQSLTEKLKKAIKDNKIQQQPEVKLKVFKNTKVKKKIAQTVKIDKVVQQKNKDKQGKPRTRGNTNTKANEKQDFRAKQKVQKTRGPVKKSIQKVTPLKPQQAQLVALPKKRGRKSKVDINQMSENSKEKPIDEQKPAKGRRGRKKGKQMQLNLNGGYAKDQKLTPQKSIQTRKKLDVLHDKQDEQQLKLLAGQQKIDQYMKKKAQKSLHLLGEQSLPKVAQSNQMEEKSQPQPRSELDQQKSKKIYKKSKRIQLEEDEQSKRSESRSSNKFDVVSQSSKRSVEDEIKINVQPQAMEIESSEEIQEISSKQHSIHLQNSNKQIAYVPQKGRRNISMSYYETAQLNQAVKPQITQSAAQKRNKLSFQSKTIVQSILLVGIGKPAPYQKPSKRFETVRVDSDTDYVTASKENESIIIGSSHKKSKIIQEKKKKIKCVTIQSSASEDQEYRTYIKRRPRHKQRVKRYRRIIVQETDSDYDSSDRDSQIYEKRRVVKRVKKDKYKRTRDEEEDVSSQEALDFRKRKEDVNESNKRYEDNHSNRYWKNKGKYG